LSSFTTCWKTEGQDWRHEICGMSIFDRSRRRPSVFPYNASVYPGAHIQLCVRCRLIKSTRISEHSGSKTREELICELSGKRIPSSWANNSGTPFSSRYWLQLSPLDRSTPAWVCREMSGQNLSAEQWISYPCHVTKHKNMKRGCVECLDKQKLRDILVFLCGNKHYWIEIYIYTKNMCCANWQFPWNLPTRERDEAWCIYL